MKFSATLVAALSAIASAAAAPMRRQIVTQSASFTNGAIYFASNEPAGNNIITASIGQNGMLTIQNVIATAGRGDRGVTEDATRGPDALFSQGVISVSQPAGLVAVANPGSHSISLFRIDATNPSVLTALGAPISSGGEFPMSVAFNSAGTMLCALNSGSMDGVQCYDIDATNGLMIMPNTRRFLGMGQTTPPKGPLGTASTVVFSPDDTQVLVAVKGNPTVNATGYIASWNMSANGLTDAFARAELPTGAVAPFSLTAIPGMNAYFSADAGVGADVFDFSNGAAMVASSARTQSFPIPNQGASCWSTYSPTTGSFYTADLLTSTITEMALNASDNMKPSILNSYPIQQYVGTLDIQVAAVAGKDYLYALMSNSTAVEVLQLDGPGSATSIQQMDIAGPARQLNLAIDPTYVVGMATYVRQ